MAPAFASVPTTTGGGDMSANENAERRPDEHSHSLTVNAWRRQSPWDVSYKGDDRPARTDGVTLSARLTADMSHEQRERIAASTREADARPGGLRGHVRAEVSLLRDMLSGAPFPTAVLSPFIVSGLAIAAVIKTVAHVPTDQGTDRPFARLVGQDARHLEPRQALSEACIPGLEPTRQEARLMRRQQAHDDDDRGR